MDYPVPNEEQEKILQLFSIDPKEVAVKYQTEDTLRLLHYKSGHEIVIKRGNRPW